MTDSSPAPSREQRGICTLNEDCIRGEHPWGDGPCRFPSWPDWDDVAVQHLHEYAERWKALATERGERLDAVRALCDAADEWANSIEANDPMLSGARIVRVDKLRAALREAT